MYKRLTYAALLIGAIMLGFSGNDYMTHLLVMTYIFATLAISLDIIIGYMGQITLGHAGFFGIGGYTSALLSLKLGVPVWLGWLGAIGVAGALGLFIGYVSFRTARGVSLAIITFGFGLVLLLIIGGWYPVTGGWAGLTKIPVPVLAIPGLPQVSFESPFSYYYLALALLLLTIYFTSRLWHSKFGRAIVALRENEALAKSIGVYAFWHYVLAFTLGATLAGLAGAAYVHYIRVITPDLLGMYYVFTTLIMVIMGGKGTIPGPILGSAICVFVPEWLSSAGQFRVVLLGIVFLVCILFMPNGIYPSVLKLWNRAVWFRRRFITFHQS